MASKNSDNLMNRREYVFIQVHSLLSQFDEVKTVSDALHYIADNLLFVHYKTVYRDYVNYLRFRNQNKF